VMHDENELVELKELYEELRADSKTLIRDMVGGISMYRFSSYLLFLMTFFPIYYVIMALLGIISGNSGFWEWYNLIVNSVAIGFFTLFGWKLRNAYSKLKDRYAKLIKMKSNIED